ncbi:unnamed protein product, partial [marine sediment metagenome]
GSGEELVVKGARQNNLKNIDVRVPLGKFVCVTGVSGSGKSTLIDEIMYKKLAQLLYRSRERAGNCDGIIGVEHIDKVVNIDQSPIGRTPRSNPATYIFKEVQAGLNLLENLTGYYLLTPGKYSLLAITESSHPV